MNEKYQRYINYITDDLEPPYSKNMDDYGLSDDEKKLILSKIYGKEINIRVTDGKYLTIEILDCLGNRLYWESPTIWYKNKIDCKGNTTYQENNTGWWCKNEFNENGRAIYSENSDGFWVKRQFNDNNKMVYAEYSNGDITDRR